MTEAGEVLIPRQEAPRNTEGELPEYKIFDLLSSVGNGENKALEIIVMKKGVIYPKAALYYEVMNHQAKDKRWEMGRTVPFTHCEKSLSPIGLVTKEAISPDGSSWGYEVAEYGLQTGVPFAGALLKWSYEHPRHSLYKMSASTSSATIKDEQSLDKKRAPETRYKIFWEIATNPSNRIRLTDIKEALNEEGSLIHAHLQNLGRNGIISYEATEQGKSFAYFRRKENVVDEGIKQYKHQKTLSRNIYNSLAHEYLSVEEMVDRIIKQYPEYENFNKKSLSHTVAGILSYFEKQGHVERKKFKSDFQSELTLSDEQKEAVVSFVDLIDKFKNGDRQTIDQGREFAQKVANDSQLFTELMLKAKEASPMANKTSREGSYSYIMSILQYYPDSTVNQIMQRLEEDYDKKISLHSVSNLLRYLTGEGEISFNKTKSGHVYRVVEDPNIQAVPPQN